MRAVVVVVFSVEGRFEGGCSLHVCTECDTMVSKNDPNHDDDIDELTA